jgi:rod shape-determining protein MreD
MRQLTIAALLVVTIALQSALRAIWQPLGYVDLALILVVYFALQREPLQALIVGTVAGLAADVISGPPAVLGAGGCSKTLTAYAVYYVASRVMLDTALLRIPVLAGASLIDNLVYVGAHRLLGKKPPMPLVQSLSFKLIATMIAGTFLLYIYDSFLSERARQRRQFSLRRRVARRSSGLRRKRRTKSVKWS